MKKYITIALLYYIIISLTSCSEKDTEVPAEAYKYWAGEPAKDVQVVHGKYWESGHWSKEYTVYLELTTSALWRKDFIKQNHLVQRKVSDGVDEAPSWFKPDSSFEIYAQPSEGIGSYFVDTLNNKVFIYESQL